MFASRKLRAVRSDKHEGILIKNVIGLHYNIKFKNDLIQENVSTGRNICASEILLFESVM
jgi:hypothetical protein